MGFLIREGLKRGLKVTGDFKKIDWNNPVAVDGFNFITKVGKNVIDLLL